MNSQPSLRHVEISNRVLLNGRTDRDYDLIRIRQEGSMSNDVCITAQFSTYCYSCSMKGIGTFETAKHHHACNVTVATSKEADSPTEGNELH